MSITLVRKSQIRPLNIIRSDINTTTSGSALITKVIAGTGLSLSSSTGVNPGTGDVTIALSIATASVLGGVKIGSGLTVAVDGTISVSSVSISWGSITGTLSHQTDLQAALNAKYNNPAGTTSQYIDGTGALRTFPTGLATEAFVTNNFVRLDGTSIVQNTLNINSNEMGGTLRSWMTRGVLVGGGGSDGAYFGMKVIGANDAQAVIAWGDDSGDNLHFINASSGGPLDGVTYMTLFGLTNIIRMYTNLDVQSTISAAQGNSVQWSEAYSWGNHSSVGYLTGFTETDPTVPAHVKAITTTNISNWNTAYSWGNHASQGYATQTYVNTAVSNLVDAAPGALDTLNELAAALGDDPNFATTVTNSIATKLPLAGGTMSGDIILGAGANLLFTGGSHSISGNSTGYLHFYGYTDVYFNDQLVIRGGIRNDNGDVRIDDNLAVSGTISASGYNSSNWDTAFSWGNHAGLYALVGHVHTFASITSKPTTIAGYGITNAYTDAQIQNFFNGANAITGYNKSNWDTAYSWGNHASAGYRLNTVNDTAYVYAITYRTENYNFTLDPRQSIGSMSIKLWDNYFNNSGLGVDYGSLLDIYGRGGHVHSQFYMDAGGGLFYRMSPYAGGWSSWASIWTSSSLTNLNQLVNGPGYLTSLPSHNHDDRYYTESESDSRFLRGTTDPGTPGNFTLSIGNNGSFSYIQSHASKPLRLNPLGNALEGPSGSTIWHSGNLTNLNQLANGPGYITGEVDPIYTSERDSLLLNKMVHTTQLWSTLAQYNRPSGYSAMIQPGSYQNPVGTHGYYHIIARRDGGGGYGALLQAYNSGEIYHGNTTENTTDIRWYRIWNSSNFNPSSYYLASNPSNFISSYTETDTLNSVTTRGASTSNSISVGGLIVTTRDVDVRTHQGRFQVYNASGSGNLGYRIQTDEQGGWRWQFVDGGNTEYFGVEYPSGNLVARGTITEQSSLRYKENITNLESITDKVDRLRPVRYNKIGNTTNEIGLIAEEVAEIFPEFVNYNVDGQAESLNYTRLTVVLLQTVKELSDKINKLETK